MTRTDTAAGPPWFRAAGPAALVVLGTTVAAAAWLVAQSTAIFLNWDFWTYARYAAQADLSRPASMLPGFWGMGFPLLLRAGTEAGFDALRVAHAASAISSGIAVALCGAITVLATRSWAAGLAAAVIVALMEPMLILASGEFNIPPANAFALGALAATIASTRAGTARSRVLWAAAAGVSLGLAALFRHQVLALVPLLALALLVTGGTWQLRLGSTLALGGGVAIGFGPEMVASLAAYGVPIHSLQAKNLWLVTAGGDDFANWGLVPDTISLGELAAMVGWGTIAGRWWEQLGVALTNLDAWPWPWPFHLAVLASTIAILGLREITWPVRILLAGTFWITLATTVVFRPETRFLVLAAMAGTMSLVTVAWALVTRPGLHGIPRRAALLGVGGTCALLLLTRPPTAVDWLQDRQEPDLSRALRLLTREARLAGATPGSLVIGNKEAFHLVDDRRRLVFTPLGTLANLPLLGPDHYLVLGTREGSFDLDVRPALPALDAQPGRYAPMAILDWARIYCTSPCEMPPVSRPIATWDNGIQLLAQRPAAFQQERGIVLYWTATRPVPDSLKLSLRLLAPDGSLVWQEDGIPALDRYPTSRWAPGEIVVDAHRLPDVTTCPDCRLVLLVYDEATTAPQAPAGSTDPFVPLVREPAPARR